MDLTLPPLPPRDEHWFHSSPMIRLLNGDRIGIKKWLYMLTHGCPPSSYLKRTCDRAGCINPFHHQTTQNTSQVMTGGGNSPLPPPPPPPLKPLSKDEAQELAQIIEEYLLVYNIRHIDQMGLEYTPHQIAQALLLLPKNIHDQLT